MAAKCNHKCYALQSLFRRAVKLSMALSDEVGQCLSTVLICIRIFFLQHRVLRVYIAPFWTTEKKISERTEGSSYPPTIGTWHPLHEVVMIGNPVRPSTINFIDVANGLIVSQLESPVAILNNHSGLKEAPFTNQVSWFAKIWTLHFMHSFEKAPFADNSDRNCLESISSQKICMQLVHMTKDAIIHFFTTCYTFISNVRCHFYKKLKLFLRLNKTIKLFSLISVGISSSLRSGKPFWLGRRASTEPILKTIQMQVMCSARWCRKWRKATKTINLKVQKLIRHLDWNSKKICVRSN